MTNETEKIAVRVRIYGRVQGVAFRAWTAAQAGSRNLHGWVRNRKDGSVEALFVGMSADVEAMVASCEAGPPMARVEHVAQERAQGIAPSRFEIKPTV